MKYSDTLLPNQRLLKKYFSDKDYYKNLYELILKTSRYIEPNKKFKLIKHNKVNHLIMGSNPVSLQFISFLIKILQPKNILEIGTFIGISAMEFASSSSKKTKVYTLEKFDEFADIAEKNFKLNNFSNIKLIRGDANNQSKALKIKFDFIFLDGNKENYLNLFKITIKKMNSNGIYIVDNVFNQGDSLNKKAKTDKGQGVKKLLKYIQSQKNYNCTLLPIYDGILIIKKN